ncbi:MAG: histidine kinase, partial [Pedobacter sp.]|nr:histidine kinase [Pedobacter sp.]
VIITVNGINAQNAYDYEFRILEDNKKVVLDWKRPKIFTDVYVMSRIADPNKIDEVTAYLGQFKEDFGKALTFQVRQLSSPDSVSASITAYWVRWQPKVVGVFTFAQLPEFLSIFRQQWYDPRLAYERPDWSKDSTLLKQKKKFLHNENNLIFYLDDIIKSKNIIEYRLIKGRDSTKWAVNDFDFNLVWLKNLSPGRYELQIRYSVQRTNVCHYVFNIEAAWYQTLWAKLGLTMLGLLAIGFVALLWRSKKQAENLKTQSTLKQVVQTELKSIRSQFNPHFVFNALSSIQGLITKNDPENASKYLIEFSNLMRDSLKASTNEFVSIASEVRILENYLKLEKLRFGFQYEIIISDLINVNAIEIPSLFLQPLVENAVKHGISSLQENGLLAISFQKSGNNMEVNVTDNGKGFEKNEQSTGFGLQLTKERIKLLNQTLQEQKIEFSVYRISDKTRVTIHFKDWLL